MRAVPPALLAAVLAALEALAPAAARAADPPSRVAIRLDYIRRPGAQQTCPPEQALHDEVATRMGYDPFTRDAPDRIVATLTRSARGLVATVERFDSKGISQWDPKTYDPLNVPCGQLVRAMGIYISYRFMPRPALPPPETPSPSPPPTTPASSSEPSGASSPPPSSLPALASRSRALPPQAPVPPPPGRRLRLELGLSPLVAFGFGPRPTLAGMLHVGLRWPSFSVAAEGRADAPGSVSAEPLPSATIGTYMLGGSVVACWHVAPVARWPRLGLMLGGSLTTTAVLGHSEGIPTTRRDVDVYMGTGPRVGVDLRLGTRFIASLYGDASVALKPQQARIGGMEVWHAWPVAGDVGGAIHALF